MPSTPAPPGWRWTPLTQLARMESGHTPSRKHPEYWGSDIPWISIRDAKRAHGGRIEDTEEHVTPLGIENSSARVLPAGTVCLSRTASVGYVVVMDRPMATSQDFVSWVCSNELDPDFLKYLLLAEGEGLLRFASGAVHQTIYFPEAKAFHVCHPSVAEQKRTVTLLEDLLREVDDAAAATRRLVSSAEVLFRNQLRKVFADATPSWPAKPFEECIESVRYTTKIQRNEFLNNGKYPVISQEAAFINGFWNARNDVYRVDRPVILFGDHTTSFKYVDFDFVLGADGVKILSPKQFLAPRFFYHQVRSIPLESLGYARHYRLLRETSLIIPPLEEQITLARSLDHLEQASQSLAAQKQRKLVALNELKQSLLHHAFTGQL